jgi:hypothetical protein
MIAHSICIANRRRRQDQGDAERDNNRSSEYFRHQFARRQVKTQRIACSALNDTADSAAKQDQERQQGQSYRDSRENVECSQNQKDVLEKPETQSAAKRYLLGSSQFRLRNAEDSQDSVTDRAG